MTFDLVPKEKIMFRCRRKIAIGGSVFLGLLLLATIIDGLCNNICEVWFPAGVLVCFALFLWYPSIRYGKIAQSSVVFSECSMDFTDRKGHCLRSVPYTSVTQIQVRDVYGSFYGIGRDEALDKYICFYLNGCRTVPNVDYHRLFSHKDFTMLYYREEIIQTLKSHNLPCFISDSTELPPLVTV